MPLFVHQSLLLIAAATFSTVTWASTSSSSSTAPDRPSLGARRDPSQPVSAQQRQGPPGSSSRSPTDLQGQRKSTADRKKLEMELLIGIRTEILRRLGLPDNRTSVIGDMERESVGGGEEMSNRTLELMRMIEDKEKHQEAMKDEMDHLRGGGGGGGGEEGKTPHGGKINKVVLRTILFGEKVANLTDDSIVQFKLNQNSNRDLLVTAATVTVLVRPGRTGAGHRRQEADRLNIQIFALAENDTRPAGDPLTEVSVLAKRTKVQRLLLPTSYVQKALDSHESVLRLKIVCDSCGVDDRDGGGGGDPDRKGRKPQTRSVAGGGGGGGQGKEKKRLRARNNLQNIPFLTISSKRKAPQTQRRARGGRMQKTARGSGK